MGRSIKFCEIALRKAMAFILCLILCFTFIPLLDNEGTTVNASETLKIGDYVQMGTYYGEPILWRCVDIDENGPLMLSDKILCVKAFDANGGVTTGSHGRGYDSGSYRQSRGSNCWEDSNLRCWLNSTASAGDVVWTCGNKPDEDHVWKRYNEYDNEAGFLTNFTPSERNCMKSVTQHQLLDPYEYDDMSIYGSREHCCLFGIGEGEGNFNEAYKKEITDTMFLLDVRQLSEVYQNGSSLGVDYYIGEPTAKCVENSEFTSSSLKTGNKWYYWLRSPVAVFYGYSSGVYCVNLDGGLNVNNGGGYQFCSAEDGDIGVRPAFYLNLSSTSFVSGNGSERSPYTVAGVSSNIELQKIKIGDYVLMGTYYGEPILWRCVDIDENGPLMLSDKILCAKAFDARGTVTKGSHGRGYTYDNNKGEYRQSNGSNCWEDSNIRCWLNSTASAGNVEWVCGNPPSESYVLNRNKYDNEAGFLTNFTPNERNCMKSVTQHQLLDPYEYDDMSGYGSDYHTSEQNINGCVTNFSSAYKKEITDMMFLLDVRQVNKVYQNENILGADYYIGEPTAKCVENIEYTYSSVKYGEKWRYWLRSPHAGNNGSNVRYIGSAGSVYYDSAYDSYSGVRPAFYLNLLETDFCSGDGTEGNPYAIERHVSSINVGDYVQMGSYYGEPILWRCVDIDENGPLMLSDKILCLKAFDASGDVTTGSHGRGDTKGYYRQKYGSNCWEDSNIRCWLNSTASAENVVWTCGNKPDEGNIMSGYNEYNNEAGFLTNFTQSERNCMKSVMQFQLLDRYEYDDDRSSYGSIYHTYNNQIKDCITNFSLAYKKKTTDTMFLLDVRQVNKVYENGSTLGADYYIGEPTAKCVENIEYTYSSVKYGEKWRYWLRSPYTDHSNSTYVRSILSDGTVGRSTAYYGHSGVRPAFYLNLSSTSFLSGFGCEGSPLFVVAKELAPAAPTVTIDYTNEKTEQVIDSTIEYKVGDGEWVSGNGTNVELLPGTTYKFRVKATENEVAGSEKTITVPARPATPSITIDYAKETATTLITHEYSTDNGSTWTDCTENMSVSNLAGETINIRVKATNALYASLAQEITLERPGAPEKPTLSNKTDTTVILTDVAGCEYKFGEGDTWQDSNEFTGLTAGQSYTFYQRYKATESAFHSESSTGLTVSSKNANSWTTEPTIANVTYGTAISPVGTAAHGSATISYVGTGNTNYNGTAAPTNAGTYQATFTVAETDDYLGLTKTVDFTINKANPSYSVPTGLNATTGETLADITLPSGFSWEEAASTSVGSAGTNTFHVKYTPEDTNNYNEVENIEVTVTVTEDSSSNGIFSFIKKIFNIVPNIFKRIFSIFK